MDFIVYRDSWLRGTRSSLLNGSNQMCCLGQVGFQCGIPLDKMRGVGSPSSLVDRDRSFLNTFVRTGLITMDRIVYGVKVTDNSDFAATAMKTNDRSDMGESREWKLVEQFQQAGHTLEFRDGIAPWFEAA